MMPRLFLAVLLAVLAAAPARAANDAAEQLVGLFLQGCLPFAGDPGGLRKWASQVKLPVVPDPGRAIFLNGAPGQVFDATNASGKFVVVSSDDGLCSCVAEAVTGERLTAALEATLRQAGVAYRKVIERDDKRAPDLHYREYLATLAGRNWRILQASVRDPKGGHAMLTAGTEK